MSIKGQTRPIPQLEALPTPVYARTESWGSEGSVTDWHSHPWGQLTYAATGVLTVKTQHACYVAPPHYAIWLPAFAEHQVLSEGAAEMRSLYLDMSLLNIARFNKPLVCEVSSLFRELVVRFCSFSSPYTEDSPQYRLAMVLLDELLVQKEVELQLPTHNHGRLKPICDKLLAQPGIEQSIELMAKDIELSGRSVSRLFKSQFGITFKQWRQKARLLHSLKLLASGLTVTDVALECGYDSVSAFVVAFKTNFGTTPGQMFEKKPN